MGKRWYHPTLRDPPHPRLRLGRRTFVTRKREGLTLKYVLWVDGRDVGYYTRRSELESSLPALASGRALKVPRFWRI